MKRAAQTEVDGDWEAGRAERWTLSLTSNRRVKRDC